MQHPSDPPKPSPEQTKSNPLPIPLSWIAGSAALVCVLATGAWLGFPYLIEALKNENSPKLTSNLAGAGSLLTENLPEDFEHGEHDEIPEYEGPSSAYIEAGADSKVLQFGFGSENDSLQPQDDRKMPRLMSDDNVQFVISRNQNDLIACYGDVLQDDETLAGKVDFEFAVAPDGHVAMVRVTRSTLRSKKAEDCFVEKARHWKFPQTNQDILTRFETDFTFAIN